MSKTLEDTPDDADNEILDMHAWDDELRGGRGYDMVPVSKVILGRTALIPGLQDAMKARSSFVMPRFPDPPMIGTLRGGGEIWRRE